MSSGAALAAAQRRRAGGAKGLSNQGVTNFSNKIEKSLSALNH